MSGPGDKQGPTSGILATNYADLCRIIEHPAFRIGFLDAQHGRPFDHDQIMRRIVDETPPRALERISWPWSADYADEPVRAYPLDLHGLGELAEAMDLGRRHAVELAQYRYEEGRKAVIEYGLRCKAWGHPDFPPRMVMDFVWRRSSGARSAA